MAVLHVTEAGDGIADAGMIFGAAADSVDEDWYYVGSTDNYVRRIEGAALCGKRTNHIVLWGCDAAAAIKPRGEEPPLIGCELGSHPAARAVSISYGPGANPTTATITIGTATVTFDPRTVVDVILWRDEPGIARHRSALFTWDSRARCGAGAFVFSGYVG